MNILLKFKDFFTSKIISPPRILGTKETIERIICNKMSISRFGEGEIGLLLNIRDIRFQRRNVELSKKLLEVLNSDDKLLLICLPKIFDKNDLNNFNDFAYTFWYKYVIKNRLLIYKLINKDKTYGNSLFTRNYIDNKDNDGAKEYFNNVRMIWDNKNIIVVEGRYTRFGVNNDLLSNAASVKRILCPAENAFDRYDKILDISLQQNNSNTLFLLALGPTATVLAYDLCKNGCWAIDIGHLDIEYEWFIMGATTKTKIENKYVNETNDVVNEENDTLINTEYEKQIICKIY